MASKFLPLEWTAEGEYEDVVYIKDSRKIVLGWVEFLKNNEGFRGYLVYTKEENIVPTLDEAKNWVETLSLMG